MNARRLGWRGGMKWTAGVVVGGILILFSCTTMPLENRSKGDPPEKNPLAAELSQWQPAVEPTDPEREATPEKHLNPESRPQFSSSGDGTSPAEDRDLDEALEILARAAGDSEVEDLEEELQDDDRSPGDLREVTRGGNGPTGLEPIAENAENPAKPPAITSPATAPSAGKPPAGTEIPPGAPPRVDSTPAGAKAPSRPLVARASPSRVVLPQESSPQSAKARPPRPDGKVSFYTFFHKRAIEYLHFLEEQFPDLMAKGHASVIDGQPRSMLFIGDDDMLALLTSTADNFDDLGLVPRRVILHPKFVDVKVAMETMNMAGVANVWNRVEEAVTTNWLDAKGKVAKTYTHKQNVYSQGGLARDSQSPISVASKLPYVFELPWNEPFEMPRVSTGRGELEQMTIPFPETTSSGRRGSIVAVGTEEDLKRIREFLDEIDQPARLIMIEVQIVELDASKLTDIGVDAFQFGRRHTIINGSLNLPGEPLLQPGIPGAPRSPSDIFIPPTVASGITGMFDDTTVDLTSRFMANIHLLVRKGDAKVKARPKILALDDRVSILHIGDELPTFQSTGVTREVTGGNFVENVDSVSTQYVGFTLNMRPRVSGENEDEVALQLEVVATQLIDRQQVFAQDLLGIPTVTRRRFVGQTRVKNHRPIILGGIIVEEESETVTQIPILGDIPLLKYLFSRRVTTNERLETILILTPHILSTNSVDRVATPKETVLFDTFDSVLFNDRYIIKGGDVQGIDPITKQPATTLNGKLFTQGEVMDLTLLKIVKGRKLVSKLGIFKEYLPVDSRKLGWLQRRSPEKLVGYWSDEKKEVYFKAAAIVIENIKELNPDLDYRELVMPRREIVLPTTPYRMTLSYDKYKTLVEEGNYLLRGGRVELSQATVNLLMETAQARTVYEFADYLARIGVSAEQHTDLPAELTRLTRALHPGEEGLDPGNYPEFLRQLASLQIDFMVMATYFQDNLGGRYRAIGAPDMGTFEKDLASFLETTVTITQRAKRLLELESLWTTVSTADGE